MVLKSNFADSSAGLWISTSSPKGMTGPTSDTFVKVSPRDEVRVWLSPSSTVVGPDLGGIPEQIRGCKAFDRHHFRYSPSRCVTKHVYAAVKQYCGCVPFTVKAALVQPTKEDTICNFGHSECLSRFLTRGPAGTGPGKFQQELNKACLPACFEETYAHAIKIHPGGSTDLTLK